MERKSKGTSTFWYSFFLGILIFLYVFYFQVRTSVYDIFLSVIMALMSLACGYLGLLLKFSKLGYEVKIETAGVYLRFNRLEYDLPWSDVMGYVEKNGYIILVLKVEKLFVLDMPKEPLSKSKLLLAEYSMELNPSILGEKIQKELTELTGLIS